MLPAKGTKNAAGAIQEIVAVKPAATTDASEVNRIVSGPLVEVSTGGSVSPVEDLRTWDGKRRRVGTVDVDDVRLLEWRAASDLPAGAWVEADAVRASDGAVASLVRRDCA